jgi:hypothetical protein
MLFAAEIFARDVAHRCLHADRLLELSRGGQL